MTKIEDHFFAKMFDSLIWDNISKFSCLPEIMNIRGVCHELRHVTDLFMNSLPEDYIGIVRHGPHSFILEKDIRILWANSSLEILNVTSDNVTFVSRLEGPLILMRHNDKSIFSLAKVINPISEGLGYLDKISDKITGRFQKKEYINFFTGVIAYGGIQLNMDIKWSRIIAEVFESNERVAWGYNSYRFIQCLCIYANVNMTKFITIDCTNNHLVIDYFVKPENMVPAISVPCDSEDGVFEF